MFYVKVATLIDFFVKMQKRKTNSERAETANADFIFICYLFVYLSSALHRWFYCPSPRYHSFSFSSAFFFSSFFFLPPLNLKNKLRNDEAFQIALHPFIILSAESSYERGKKKTHSIIFSVLISYWRKSGVEKKNTGSRLQRLIVLIFLIIILSFIHDLNIRTIL